MPPIKFYPSSSTCPRCGKTFQNAARVASHMAQPLSHCNVHQDALREANSQLKSRQLPTQSSFLEPPLLEIGPPSTPPPGPPHDHIGPQVLSPVEPHFQLQPASRSLEITYHPSAAATYGQGTTFLGAFNQDQFSECRKTNIYYPFASKRESELGVFLIRSPMSMAEIDRFLKLDMVRCYSFYF